MVEHKMPIWTGERMHNGVVAISRFSLAIVLIHANPVLAQGFPSKPIRIITTPAGGGNDLSARNIALGISGPIGQNVIVENRPTRLVSEIAVKAHPDGYTLLLQGSSFSVTPFLEKTSYHPVRDFSPISIVDTSPSILVVTPSLPAKSVKELIALAKAKPGELNYPSGGAGSANHLATELFKSLAGINLTHIPYTGAGPALTALMGGQVQLMIPNVSATLPFVRSGKLRALAIGSAAPSALAPDLPMIAASGVVGYEDSSVHVILAPKGTPAAVISRLNREIVKYLSLPDTKEKFLKSGLEVVASSPAELAVYLKTNMAKWEKVIKSAGIRAE